MYVYINDEIKKASDARLSVFEHGFMYGLGLFETFRIYDGHPFLLDDHFERLERGLQEMNISWRYNREEVFQNLKKLLEANQWKNAYVRYNIAAGKGELGLAVDPYQEPTEIIYMKPLDYASKTGKNQKQGRILEVRRNTPETSERLKSHHFLNSMLGKWELRGEEGVEGIFLTECGHIAEGTVSNVFWVKNHTIYTPSLQTGILPGITRSFIIQLAKKLSFHVRVGKFPLQHLMEADEAFVTNSIQEIVSLTAINDKQFEKGKDSLTDVLLDKYRQYCHHLWKSEDIFNKMNEI
ncbi:aminodeoxychorismate lyase [Alteribacillus iranensis]|uniref:4-amino-4-deoxychorismate lyase n=1 Tax=Alteribacillus iranensis TaxID=930128 RepID=A0A1I2FEN0_9BACI|nr:aminodeoxychorismate lyase [Alteribacillus iranensis]SFF03872.1 4-amino-4-deoxychorismate lyase [Alteribacillus iranensis]